jgi:hypothetical protein
VTRLFALAIFCSATLLFMVQPLAGRIVLPVLGGSPAVWSTCMVFFQAVLLLGYLYAHVLGTHLPRRWQWAIHLGVLIAASLTLPMPIDIGEPGGADPRWWLIKALTGTIFVPFFALAATAPLLQSWFSRTTAAGAGDPYFLYAASNAGSLLGLFGYLLIEPAASRGTQVTGWAAGFWVVALLVLGCAYASRRFEMPIPAAARSRRASAASRSQPVLWIALALVPSALLIGVTQHLATDVVSAPLLWVAPLALYLATFMAAFSARSYGSARRWGAVAAVMALLVLFLSLGEIRYPILPVMLAHLAAFAALAMLCHTRLAESRPDPSRLTAYFLCISFGGVLGGVAAALVAPVVFSSVLEYPLAIAAALLLRPQTADADRMAPPVATRTAWRAAAAALLLTGYWCVYGLNDPAHPSSAAISGGVSAALQSLGVPPETTPRVVRIALAVPVAILLVKRRTALLFAGAAAGLLVGAAVIRTGGAVLDRERTFFGVHQVTAIQNGDWHVLTHGTTTHGVQAVRGRMHALPTAYYHPAGPLGDVVFTLVPDRRFADVAVVGLGAGALAAYAGQDARMDFFEIDPAVIRIAEDRRYFTYLADARLRPGVTVRTVRSDGRLALRAAAPGSYDLIVIDAFSSDAIPTHLLTAEAVALYESRLKPRGVIAFHVSSRFFNLPPIIARIAAERRLAGYVRDDHDVPPEKAAEATRPSVWVVLARDENDLGQVARSAPRWTRLAAGPGAPLWTDDYSSLLGVLQ